MITRVDRGKSDITKYQFIIYFIKNQKKMKKAKKEFVKLNVGVDMSKDDFKACFSGMTPEIDIVILGSRTFDNNLKGFVSFLEWISQKNVKNTDFHVSFTVEATGVYYEALAYFLFEKGHAVHVVLPNQSKKYGQSLGVRSKTDKY
jgi:transposase